MIAQLPGGGPTAPVTFTVSDIIQFVSIAFLFGTIFAQVRWQGKRLDALVKETAKKNATVDSRFNRLEEQFLGAIDKLSEGFSDLKTELKVIVAGHEARITNVEDREREK